MSIFLVFGLVIAGVGLGIVEIIRHPKAGAIVLGLGVAASTLVVFSIVRHAGRETTDEVERGSDLLQREEVRAEQLMLLKARRATEVAQKASVAAALEPVDNMSTRDLVGFALKIFQAHGLKVALSNGYQRHDVVLQGTDSAHREVQIRFIARSRYHEVGAAGVRELLGRAGNPRVSGRLIVFTTASFTGDARRFGEYNSIELIDGTRLVEMAKSAGVKTGATDPFWA